MIWQREILFDTMIEDILIEEEQAKGVVTEKGEKYSFKVKKNGKYTIWISDDKGNIYTKVVTVKGLKK